MALVKEIVKPSIGGRERDRTIVAKMEQHLNEGDNMKVEIEELELLLGSEESEVDLKFIVMNATRKQGRRLFSNPQHARSE